MTPKERWLAAIHLQPVDRLPFWPKIDRAYPLAQETRFRTMGSEGIHRWVGSDQHDGVPVAWKDVHSRCSTETVRENGTTRQTFTTPHGELTLVQRFDPGSQSHHPVDFPVKTREDVEILTEFFSDVTVELERQAIEDGRQRYAEIGQEAIVASGVGISPMMDWIQHYAGIENGQYLLADYPEEVDALFEAMHRVVLRRSEIEAQYSPADMLYLTENTSTTLISPEQYRRHCLPYKRRYAQVCVDAGKPMVLHMCGHLKAILPDINTVPARSFEAFTSPPVGNTTLADGRSACPEKCLIGGTNAALWTRSAAEIISQIEHDLGELPHHRGVVITSAGVMPPLAAPETIRAVGDWVKAYPARM